MTALLSLDHLCKTNTCSISPGLNYPSFLPSPFPINVKLLSAIVRFFVWKFLPMNSCCSPWSHFGPTFAKMSHQCHMWHLCWIVSYCVTLCHAFWSMLSIHSCSLITCLLGLLSGIYFILMHQSMSQFFGCPHIATMSWSTECPQNPLFQALSTSPQYVHVYNKCWKFHIQTHRYQNENTRTRTKSNESQLSPQGEFCKR